MTLDELKTRVKIKMDEYTPSGVSHSFDDYLEPMIQEAADEITDTAPKHLLVPTNIPTTNIKYQDDLAFIPVPADHARLYDVLFPLWSRPVLKALVPDDPDYALQDNEYLKAGYGRPAVRLKTAIPTGGTLQKYFICGKVLSSATPTYARYIAYVTAANMPDGLDEALTWLAASKVFQVLGETDMAKLTYENYIKELTIKE